MNQRELPDEPALLMSVGAGTIVGVGVWAALGGEPGSAPGARPRTEPSQSSCPEIYQSVV